MHNSLYKFVINALNFLGNRFARTHVLKADNLIKADQNIGTIIVLNHISEFDPIIVGGTLGKYRRLRVLAKESLFKKPVLGYLLKKLKHVPVARNSEKAKDAIEAGKKVLLEKDTLILYPEGTISFPEEPLSFKKGFARIAVGTSAPTQIIPIGQWGIHEMYPPYDFQLKRFLKSLIKRQIHIMAIGSPILVDDQVKESGVEHLTIKVQDAVKDLTSTAKNHAQSYIADRSLLSQR